MNRDRLERISNALINEAKILKDAKENDPKIYELLKDANALARVEQGLGDYYDIEEVENGFKLNKIPDWYGVAKGQPGLGLNKENPLQVSDDTLVALAMADLHGDRPPVIDNTYENRKASNDLVAALDQLNAWGGDIGLLRTAGERKEYPRTSEERDDIRMVMLGDLDRGVNPITGAPFGSPFEDKETGLIVREVVEGGHISPAATDRLKINRADNIVGELKGYNRATQERGQGFDITDEQAFVEKASQYNRDNDGAQPVGFIKQMKKLAIEKPELRPRINHLMKRIGQPEIPSFNQLRESIINHPGKFE